MWYGHGGVIAGGARGRVENRRRRNVGIRLDGVEGDGGPPRRHEAQEHSAHEEHIWWVDMFFFLGFLLSFLMDKLLDTD